LIFLFVSTHVCAVTYLDNPFFRLHPSQHNLAIASSRFAMGVLEFLSDQRFHQSYVLPPNLKTGRDQAHRFSYADFGDPSSNAVVFFCGALMGTRFCYSPMDQLAKTYNVRIIHVDKPGIGGSDPTYQ
jgi:hypothetical protein